MGSESVEELHKARAMEFANLGILLGADGDHQAAGKAWLDALGYAEQHLQGSTIIPWIRSGLGDSLLRTGEYRGALEMAGSALEFCAAVQAPAASLTMAEAYLRLGYVTRARKYARLACDLKGEKVLKVFSPADQKVLGMTALR